MWLLEVASALACALIVCDAWKIPRNPRAVQILHEAHKLRAADYMAAAKMYKQVSTMGDWSATGDAFYALGEVYFPQSIGVDYMQRSARLGNPNAQHQVSLMYAVGFLNSNSSTSKSILYDHFSSIGGDSRALMSLGYRSLVGNGMPKSCVNALTYYKRAATIVFDTTDSTFKVNSAKDILLPESKMEDDKEDFNRLLFLASAAEKAKKGVTLVRIAKILLQQPQQQFALALRLLVKALSWGEMTAAAHLGHFYAHGWGVPVNETQAQIYYTMNVKDAEALYGLGKLFLLRKGTDQSLSLHYFQEASKLGHLESIYQAALLLTSKAPQMAKRYFEAASKSGHILSTFKYAETIQLVHPTEISCNALVKMFKRVAESAPSPLLDLAWTKVKAKEFDNALLLYRMAGEEGYGVAQTNAAWLIREGYAREPSHGIYQWMLQNAAVQGSGFAQLELANALYNNKMYDEALESYSALISKPMFRTSNAYLYIAPALFQIGYMYETGISVEMDRDKAFESYQRMNEIERRFRWPIQLWKWKWWLQDLLEKLSMLYFV